ncbi:hypothetical protein EMCRGX_G004696 [Ephydatia muelleri]
MHHWGFQALSFWHSPLLLSICQRSKALWKQHAPQLDVRLVVLPMSQHWIVHLLKSQSEMWGPPLTATVQFHTYNPSGILFHQINSVVTDFLGVKLHGGLPLLIFDVGSGPAVVGSNSTRTFIDDQWHTHVSYPLLNAPDGFDAVPVQNVGSTYIIVSWDLPTDSNGILINFTTPPPASSPSLCTCTCMSSLLLCATCANNSPPVTPTGTALQLEWASSVLRQPAQSCTCTPAGTSLAKLHLPFILPVLTCWSHECLGQYAPLAERRVVVASGHKEHEEPLAVSIPSHHWMENYICPFTVVNYTCTITSGTAAGYTDWTLPTGTCPTNAFFDKIRLSQLFLKLWVFTVHWVQSSGQD